jgi:hypothetical protein
LVREVLAATVVRLAVRRVLALPVVLVALRSQFNSYLALQSGSQ